MLTLKFRFQNHKISIGNRVTIMRSNMGSRMEKAENHCFRITT